MSTEKATRARRSRKADTVSQESNKPEITLAQVVEATQDPERGFMYASGEFVLLNEGHGFIEVNQDPTTIRADGAVMVRATPAGIAFVQAEQNSEKGVAQTENVAVESVSTVHEQQAAPQTNQVSKEPKKMTFAVETVEIPAVKRGRGAATKYPFDLLEVGQSFFVPNSASEKGNAAKSVASSVAAANKRYSQEIAGQTRVNRKGKTVPATEQIRLFETRSVEKDPVHGEAGVRVVRTK